MFQVSLKSGRQISVVVGNVFEYFISKNSTYPWVYFFGAPFDAATYILCGIFFQIAEIPQGPAVE